MGKDLLSGASKKGGKKMTNFERIKGMGVEELAEFLYRVTVNYEWGGQGFAGSWKLPDAKEWLESECDAEC